MNGKDISYALSGLPEDMIAEAMAPVRKHRSIPWLRVAVCFAAVLAVAVLILPTSNDIVTAPGILAVTVYALDEEVPDGYVKVLLKTGIEPGLVMWTPAMNLLPGMLINFNMETEEFPKDKIEFRLFVDNGVYVKVDDSVAPAVVNNDSSLCWRPHLEDFFEYGTDPSYENVYSDVIIFCEDRIIGYAVILFNRVGNPKYQQEAEFEYTATLIASEYFPKRNGYYQDIDIEWLEEMLKSLRDVS